jgi:hypothetical protein
MRPVTLDDPADIVVDDFDGIETLAAAEMS